MKVKLKTKILVYFIVSALVCTEMRVYAQNAVDEEILLQQNEENITDSQENISEDVEVIENTPKLETDNLEEGDINIEAEQNANQENFQENINENDDMFSTEENLLEEGIWDENAEEILLEEGQTELIEEENQIEIEEVELEVLEELSPLGTRIDTEPERDRYKIYAEMAEEDVDKSREIKGDIWMAGFEEDSLVYTGSVVKQDVRIYDGDKELVINKDYKITYKNNTNAKEFSSEESLTGVPCMTVQMLSGYTGSRTFYYSILQADINEAEVSDQEVALSYNGKVQNYVPGITFHGKKLTSGKDFQIKYQEKEEYRKGSSTGKATISYTVEGKGNFKNTIKKDGDDKVFQYYIVGSDYNFSKATMNIANKNVKFYGDPITEEQLGITLKIGKKLFKPEYGLFAVELKGFNGVGTGTIVVTPSESAKEDNYVGSLQKTYKIAGGIDFKKSVKVNEEVWQTSMPYRKNIADTESGLTQETENLLKNARDIYVPGENEPIIEEGTSLTEGVDYSVTYSANKKAGTAKATFKGLGKYNGSFSKTFKIVADDTFTVEPLSSVPYQKGGVSPELIVKDREGNPLKKNTDYTVKFTKNTKVGTEAHYTVKGKGNFSSKTIVEGNFEIVPSNIAANCTIQVEDKAFANKVKGYQLVPVVYDKNNGKKLSAGTDYTVSYQLLEGESAREVEEKEIPSIGSKISVIVRGKENGNYTGSISADYKIYDSKKSIKKLYIKIDSQVYTGEKIELTLSNEPGKGDIHVFLTKEDMNKNQNEQNAKDYIRIRPNSYNNNIKNGTASVTLETNPDSEYGGSAAYKFTIVKKSAQLVGVSKVSCKESNLEIAVGDSTELKYVMNPINVDNPKITITESNTSLIIGEPILGENGEITVSLSAQQMGMNVVTLTVVDLNRKKVSASCLVYVKDASASQESAVTDKPEGYKSILDYQTTYTKKIPSGTYVGELEWTEAFQKAIRENSGNNISGIWVPAGTYYVRQIDFKMEYPNVKLVMHPDAKLVRLPITTTENNNGRVHILWFGGARNISVSGGQLVGERKLSSSHSEEDGHGIMLMESKNITISHVKISDCWGDGIYLGIYGGHSSDKSYNNQSIVINDCYVSNSRRNGLAITNGEGILVKDSSFNDTRGIAPEFGVDIETNNSQNPVNGVYFDNCKMEGNKSASFGIITKAQNIYLKDCTMSGDFHNRACTGLTLDSCTIGGTLYLVHYNANRINGTTYKELVQYL